MAANLRRLRPPPGSRGSSNSQRRPSVVRFVGMSSGKPSAFKNESAGSTGAAVPSGAAAAPPPLPPASISAASSSGAAAARRLRMASSVVQERKGELQILQSERNSCAGFKSGGAWAGSGGGGSQRWPCAGCHAAREFGSGPCPRCRVGSRGGAEGAVGRVCRCSAPSVRLLSPGSAMWRLAAHLAGGVGRAGAAEPKWVRSVAPRAACNACCSDSK